MLLVYGYDLDKNELYTIDDVTGCNKYNLTFDELYSGYNGNYEYCNYKMGESELFYEFIIKPDKSVRLPEQNSLVNPHINEFANNMLCSKEEILQSLKSILSFANTYEDVLQYKFIITFLGIIIYGRMAEQFRLINLKACGFDSSNIHTQMNSLLTEIINDWNRVRVLIVKAINFHSLNTKEQKKAIDLMKGLYEKENQFYELLYVLVDKFA